MPLNKRLHHVSCKTTAQLGGKTSECYKVVLWRKKQPFMIACTYSKCLSKKRRATNDKAVIKTFKHCMRT